MPTLGTCPPLPHAIIYYLATSLALSLCLEVTNNLLNPHQVTKCIIEKFSDGRIAARLGVRELYSSLGQPESLVEVRDLGSRAHQIESRISRYYSLGGKVSLVLRHDSSGGCQLSNSLELRNHLFGQSSPLNTWLLNNPVQGYSKFLNLAPLVRIAELRRVPDFKQSTESQAPNWSAKIGGRLLEFYYNSDKTLRQVILRSSNGTDELRLRFDQSVGPLDKAPLRLPAASGCSELLGNSQQIQVKQLKEFAADKSVSFSLRMVGARARRFHMAFDPRSKYIRRDSPDGARVSTSIFDLKRSKRYHYFHRAATARVGGTLSSIPGPSTCTVEDIAPDDRAYLLMDFERLKYLGKLEVANEMSSVFELHAGPPAWLSPKMSRSSKSENTTDTEQLANYFVYYITDEPDYRLLRLDIIVRNKKSQKVIDRKHYQVFDYLWGQLRAYKSAREEEQPTVSVFSLASLCPGASLHGQMILASSGNSRKLSANALHFARNNLRPAESRNRVLIEMFEREFSLPLSNIRSMESQQLQLSGSSNQLAPIRLDFEATQVKLEGVECNFVGLGKLHYCNLAGEIEFSILDATSLDDCKSMAIRRLRNQNVAFFSLTNDAKCLLALRGSLDDTPSSCEACSKTSSAPIYKLTKHPVAASDTETSNAWVRILTKGFGLIGKRLTMLVGYNRPTFEVQHVDIAGPLAESHGSRRPIHNAGWRQAGESDKLVRSVAFESIAGRNLFSEGGKDVTGIVSREDCRSLCLIDLECNSLSYCEADRLSEPACSLSKLDPHRHEVSNRLQALIAKQRGRQALERIDIKDLNYGQEYVDVQLSAVCSIESKAHLSLFKGKHEVYVSLGAEDTIEAVSSNELECAKICYKRNIDYLRGLIARKLNSTQDVEGEADSDESTWYQSQASKICDRFYLVTGNGEASSCVVPTQRSIEVACPELHPQGHAERAIMYSLMFANFYSKMAGFRLKSTATGGTSKVKNHQLQVNSDDLEHCARACSLQFLRAHSRCASFDLVLEDGVRYCLLNTQSLHDLRQMQGTAEAAPLSNLIETSDATRASHYWHYEPRESILIAMDEDDSRYQQVDDIMGRFQGLERDSKDRITSEQFSLVIAFVIGIAAMVSGLWSGLRVASYINKVHTEMKGNNKVSRIIHRLSGVSLNWSMLESEVRM